MLSLLYSPTLTSLHDLNFITYNIFIIFISFFKDLLKSFFLLFSIKHGFWSHCFMANKWGKRGKVTDFIFLGSKITVDSDCSPEIKRYLLLVRKAMTNLDSVFKSREITLLTKVCLVKAMVFPVVMYGCESWTIKKTEC